MDKGDKEGKIRETVTSHPQAEPLLNCIRSRLTVTGLYRITPATQVLTSALL